MAFTPVTTLAVTKKGAMLSPPMGQQPIKGILENLHYLWQRHQPPLLSVVYCTAATTTRTTIYHIPIMPSADGIRYVFQHRFVCSAATQTVTVSVDETAAYAGAGTVWAAVYSSAVVTGGAGTLTTSTSAATTVNVASVAIRVTLTAPASGTKTDHHLLVYPAPSAPAAGCGAGSGFLPFDDGLITSADRAPIHEEWINRVAVSSRAVVADRKQCAFAFVQEYRSAPLFQCTDAIGGSSGLGYNLPSIKAVLPLSSESQTLNLRVIADVDGGATGNLVNFAGAIFDADGALNGDQITINTTGNGIDAQWLASLNVANAATRTTRLFAAVAFWTPKQPQENIISWQAGKWPVATASLLGTMASRIVNAAIGPYVGTGHVYDGVSTGLTTRYLGVMVPPGCIKARVTVTQGADLGSDSTTPTSSIVTGATAGAVTVTLPWFASGKAGSFGALDTITLPTTSNNSDITASGNGTLSLTQANAPAVEAVNVQNSVGVCVFVSRQLEDMEAL